MGQEEVDGKDERRTDARVESWHKEEEKCVDQQKYNKVIYKFFDFKGSNWAVSVEDSVQEGEGKGREKSCEVYAFMIVQLSEFYQQLW